MRRVPASTRSTSQRGNIMNGPLPLGPLITIGPLLTVVLSLELTAGEWILSCPRWICQVRKWS